MADIARTAVYSNHTNCIADVDASRVAYCTSQVADADEIFRVTDIDLFVDTIQVADIDEVADIRSEVPDYSQVADTYHAADANKDADTKPVVTDTTRISEVNQVADVTEVKLLSTLITFLIRIMLPCRRDSSC